MARPLSCEELLAEMVGFDTVNSAISGRAAAESLLAEHLANHAASLGFGARRLPVGEAGFNLLVTYAPAQDAPWLLFISHLDTVSAENMIIEPFTARVADGRVYGRGACDTKASGAAMLSALVAYRDAASHPNNVAVLFSIDEEIGKSGVKGFIHDLPALGFRPAGAIVGEPTELRPVVAHNGVVRWSIHTKGVAAHSSNPQRGRSAISMMVKVVEAIESQYIPSLKTSHPLTGPAQCSINVIRGGAQINVIPDSCSIEIDRRVVPGEDAGQVLPAVEKLLDQLRRNHPDLQVQQDTPFLDPPLEPRGNEDFIRFVESALAGMSRPHQAMGTGFGTEASNLSEAGIPAVVLGPGNIEQAHAKTEWVSLDQLHEAVEVYFHLMSHRMETTP